MSDRRLIRTAALVLTLAASAALPAAALAATPAAPGQVHTSHVTRSSVLLSWRGVAGARSYDVFLEGYSSSTTQHSFDFTQLKACTSYRLGVRARAGASHSGWVTRRVRTAGCATHRPPPAPAPAPAPKATPLAAGGLHVSGNRLLTGRGRTVRLHGVDRAGTEYACIQGWGIFDGPNSMNDDAQAPRIRAWNANSVLIGLNEDCWLGINGVRGAYGGARYRSAIVHEVSTLERHGLYPVIALFWTAPGGQQATGQAPMPDADHSPAFWHSVAATFRRDPNVIFRLKEEPFPASNGDGVAAWRCWSAGDVQYGASGSLQPRSHARHCSEGYDTVGMQSLVNIIRGAGAHNVIQVPGVQYANSMTHFLDRGIRVHDPLRRPQLMADVDLYPNGNSCGNIGCYDREYAPVARRMPFDAGEIGESVDGSDCSTGQVDQALAWLDRHGAGYYAWTWDTWGGCNQLIDSYATGAPHGAWGRDYRNRLR